MHRKLLARDYTISLLAITAVHLKKYLYQRLKINRWTTPKVRRHFSHLSYLHQPEPEPKPQVRVKPVRSGPTRNSCLSFLKNVWNYTVSIALSSGVSEKFNLSSVLFAPRNRKVSFHIQKLRYTYKNIVSIYCCRRDKKEASCSGSWNNWSPLNKKKSLKVTSYTLNNTN